MRSKGRMIQLSALSHTCALILSICLFISLSVCLSLSLSLSHYMYPSLSVSQPLTLSVNISTNISFSMSSHLSLPTTFSLSLHADRQSQRSPRTDENVANNQQVLGTDKKNNEVEAVTVRPAPVGMSSMRGYHSGRPTD